MALPVFHHFGVHAAIGVSLFNGVKTVVLEKWDVGFYFQCIEKYKVRVRGKTDDCPIKLVGNDVTRSSIRHQPILLNLSEMRSLVPLFAINLFWGQSYLKTFAAKRL